MPCRDPDLHTSRKSLSSESLATTLHCHTVLGPGVGKGFLPGGWQRSPCGDWLGTLALLPRGLQRYLTSHQLLPLPSSSSSPGALSIKASYMVIVYQFLIVYVYGVLSPRVSACHMCAWCVQQPEWGIRSQGNSYRH